MTIVLCRISARRRRVAGALGLAWGHSSVSLEYVRGCMLDDRYGDSARVTLDSRSVFPKLIYGARQGDR